MSDIIPRRKAVPVQARRVEPGPETIQIPGGGSIPMPGPVSGPVPPPAPGTTQNIIYVNVPAGQAPPTAPVQPPQEIHHHTTTHVHEAPSYEPLSRRRLGRGTSYLGSLGIIIGGIAAGVAYIPQLLTYTKPIAETGAACAGLGLLGAILFRRVGRGVPFLGLIICGAAYGLMLKNTGQLPASITAIKVPKLDLSGLSTPTASPSTPVNPSTPAAGNSTPAAATPSKSADRSAPQNPSRLHDHSIFGDGSGPWSKADENAGPTPAVTPTPGASNPDASSGSTPAPKAPAVPVQPTVDAATATANLEQARTDAARRMGVDYIGAKNAAKDAQAEYQDARIGNSPGSAELIAASQKHLQADSQLTQIESRLRADPAVAAAEAVAKNTRK